MRIYKTFTFGAAHSLPEHKGQCRNLHGHTYKVEVWCDGWIDRETGMVVDFGDLRAIKRTYDHKLLNEIISNPTAEHLVGKILRDVEHVCGENVQKITVRVWESPTSWVEMVLKEGNYSD